MKTITPKTIGINDILLNNVEAMAFNSRLDRSEVIRKAVDFYLKKIHTFLGYMNKDDKRYRDDKKYGNGNLSIITCGLTNNQLSEIDSLIPGFAVSNSEFIRTAILDYLVNNLEFRIQEQNNTQKPTENDKVRVQIAPGIYKEYKLKNPKGGGSYR